MSLPAAPPVARPADGPAPDPADRPVFSEYESEPVPPHARRRTSSVAAVWLGFPMILTCAVFGGLVVHSLGFWAGMGAEAVRDIIVRMDLEELSRALHAEVRTSSGQRRKKAIKRLRLIEAFRQDYIRTARAKGISESRVVLRHALRNALVVVIALFGLDIGALIGGGTLLTEVVFGLRGIGKLTYDALQNLDLPVVMAAVLYASFFVVLANAAVDAVQAALDPRQR